MRHCVPLTWTGVALALLGASFAVGAPWRWLLWFGVFGALLAAAGQAMTAFERMSRVRLRDRRRRG